MKQSVLITGGAGFIGSHLAEILLDLGYQVKILDNLSPQIHGVDAQLVAYLKGRVEFIHGDILDRERVNEAVSGSNAVIHLAAETGVGQSMYEISRYTNVNINGTAILWEAITSNNSKIEKAILASSRAVYGEGKYECINCGVTYSDQRDENALKNKNWQMHCIKCGDVINPMPTDEEFTPRPISIYGITKLAQEQMFHTIGKAYGIPIVSLRYFNVYGPGQSLSNPYTGILSVFSSMALNGKPLPIYEDGLESRDFIYIGDVVTATVLALERSEANNEVLNVGSGSSTTIMEVAKILLERLGLSLEPVIVGHYRVGDIRHCYADLTKIREKLDFKPSIGIEDGITAFVDWVRKQHQITDLSDTASIELLKRQLLRKTD